MSLFVNWSVSFIVLGNISVKAFWWTSFFVSCLKHDLILMYLYQLWCSRMVICLSSQDVWPLSPVGGLKSAACLWQCLKVRVWRSSPSPQTRGANGLYCVRFWVFSAAVQCVLCLRIWKRSWRTSTQLLGWIKQTVFLIQDFHYKTSVILSCFFILEVYEQKSCFFYAVDYADNSWSHQYCVWDFDSKLWDMEQHYR